MADNAFADAVPAAASETYRHPKTVIAHLFFKTAAVLFYLLGTYFTSSFVVIFVMVTTLLSLDFWTVKNVTGRLLVGLRWWNKVAEDGTTEWVFESKKGKDPHAMEARLFWWSMYGFTAIWGLFFFTTLVGLKFGYTLLVVVALTLHTSNVVGYMKCDTNAKAKLSTAAADIAGTYGPGLLSSAASYLTKGSGGSAPVGPLASGP